MRRGVKRINARSAKTVEREPERQAMRQEVIAAAGGRCTMADLVPEVECSTGPLHVDERQGRGVRPGSQFDVRFGQPFCGAHHLWKHLNVERAIALGVTERSTFELEGRSLAIVR